MRKQTVILAQQEKQAHLMEQQLLYAKELEAQYQDLRKWNHDIENHFIALSYLLKNEKYQECDDYINTLMEKSDSPDLHT